MVSYRKGQEEFAKTAVKQIFLDIFKIYAKFRKGGEEDEEERFYSY